MCIKSHNPHVYIRIYGGANVYNSYMCAHLRPYAIYASTGVS